MPRLLNINSYHYRRGGSDVVYLDHASLMESIGWKNAYFSMHHPNNLPTPWSRYFIEQLEFDADNTLPQKIVMATKAIYSFEAQKQLTKLLQEHRPDIAHLHCIYHHHSPSILPVLKRAGIPIVMTAHDLKIACPAYKMLNRTGICERCKTGSTLNVIRHRCIRDSLAPSIVIAIESGLQRTMQTYRNNLSRVVTPSLFYLDKFVEWGWPREIFKYIPNYIDASRYEPAYQPGDYFLYFGRLAQEKGVETLMRASAHAGIELKIAGTGPLANKLTALNSKLDAKIEFLGFQSGDSLTQLIKGARAVVLPSEWYENAPMSILESFALGKPVIGARIGGIPELITNEENGWTFTSGSIDELRSLLTKVKNTPDSRLAQIGKAARASAMKKFTRERYLLETLSLYEELGVQQ